MSARCALCGQVFEFVHSCATGPAMGNLDFAPARPNPSPGMIATGSTALLIELQALRAANQALEAENGEFIRLIDIWCGDLEAITDDPIHGDPMKTVNLITRRMNELLERVK